MHKSKAKWKSDPPKCHYCPAQGTTKDHIVPRSLGGVNAHWNYVFACHSCNRDKANFLPTCRCRWCGAAIEKHLEEQIAKHFSKSWADRMNAIDWKERRKIRARRARQPKHRPQAVCSCPVHVIVDPGCLVHGVSTW